MQTDYIPNVDLFGEQANGPIPEGCLIVHLDGNQTNCELENLYCITPQMRAVMNRNGWLTKDPVLTLTAIRWCELFYTMKEEGV